MGKGNQGAREALNVAVEQGSAVQYSVVIPVFNEQENIPELHRRLTAVMQGLSTSYEIIFVDDGSTDQSFALMKELHQQDPHVKILRLSRNFGHHIALKAGIDYARGEAVILMDGDLQDQPEDIPKLLAKFKEGYDVVYGIYNGNREGSWRFLASRFFWVLMARLSGYPIPPHQVLLRIMSRQFVEQFKRLAERSRMTVGLIAWLGFRQIGVPIEHAPRFAGHSKYNLVKMLKLTFHAITSFSYVPLQIAGYLGFLISIISFSMGIYLVVRKLVWGISIEGWVSLIVTMLFLGGVQLIILGVIGEYLGRVYTEVQGRPLYIAEEMIGFEDN